MHYAAVLALLTTLTAVLSSQTPSKAPETCTVSGRIVRADSGEPLKSARIALREETHSEKPHTYKAFSDQEGHFSIAGIAPGRYGFVASHNGFVPQQFHPEGASGSGALLDLSPGQNLDKILFRLIPASVITGKITDEDGQPVAGVEMEALIDAHQAELLDGDSENQGPETSMLLSKLKLFPVGMGVTNDLGEYRMYGLPTGDYYVAAIDSGMPELTEHALRGGGWTEDIGNEPATDHPPMYYPGVFSRTEAQKLHAAPGATLRVDFTLRSEKILSVDGRVLTEKGQPAAGVYVTLGSRDMDLMFSSLNNTAITDEKGRFSIKSVVPGSYVLEASKVEGETQFSAELPIEIASQAPSDVALTLQRGASVHGQIRYAEPSSSQGRPELGSLHVWLSPINGSSFDFGAAEVKKDGTFEIGNVRRSTYSVSITGLPSGWYLKLASVGSTDALVHGVAVTASEMATPLDLAISAKAAQLSGTVVMNEKPAVGAVVQLVAEHESKFRRGLRRKAITDQHGVFILDNLIPGGYRVEATLSDASDVEEGDNKSETLAATKPVELAEGEKKTVSLVLKQK